MPKERTRQHYLGETAYCIRNSGMLARTAVCSLGWSRTELHFSEAEPKPQESFRLFLDGITRYEPWFDLDEAIATSKKDVEKRLARPLITEEHAKELGHYLERLKLPAFKTELASGPIAKSQQSIGLSGSPFLPADTKFPDGYFEPGETAYAIITPRSHYLFTERWQPELYFILETPICNVSYARGWPNDVRYECESFYTVPHSQFFSTHEEASQALAKQFTRETSGSIAAESLKLFKASDETAWHAKRDADLRKRYSEMSPAPSEP